MKTVTIEFKKGGTTYDYLYNGEIQYGDKVRVNSFFGGYEVVTVVAVQEGRGEKASQQAYPV